MITLVFKGVNRRGNGGSEVARFEIDRDTKTFIFASSQTGYDKVEKDWKNLFDPGKERIQEILTDKMNDEEFVNCIKASMMKIGYKLVNHRIDGEGDDGDKC